MRTFVVFFCFMVLTIIGQNLDWKRPDDNALAVLLMIGALAGFVLAVVQDIKELLQ